MSNHILNPEYRPHHDLGFDHEEWEALKATVKAHLEANAGSSVLAVDAIRDLDPALKVSDPEDPDDLGDRIWNQLASDMNLIQMPGPRA